MSRLACFAAAALLATFAVGCAAPTEEETTDDANSAVIMGPKTSTEAVGYGGLFTIGVEGDLKRAGALAQPICMYGRTGSDNKTRFFLFGRADAAKACLAAANADEPEAYRSYRFPSEAKAAALEARADLTFTFAATDRSDQFFLVHQGASVGFMSTNMRAKPTFVEAFCNGHWERACNLSRDESGRFQLQHTP